MTRELNDNAIAAITDTTTAETREVPVHYDIPDTDEVSDYLWSEGNFACDCNRGLLFYGESGECGDDRFKVQIRSIATGETVYEDMPGIGEKP